LGFLVGDGDGDPLSKVSAGGGASPAGASAGTGVGDAAGVALGSELGLFGLFGLLGLLGVGSGFFPHVTSGAGL
jgi:hypothetical protein